MADIARLRRMPVLAHSIKNYKPQPDPVQQQLQQLQVEKLQKEIALIEAQTMEAQASAQRSTAQAKQHSSIADKTNLDYVDQQSGTTHARKMDEMGAQAEANQNLEVTKGILAQRHDGAHQKDSPTPDAPNRDNLLEAFGFNELTKAQNQRPPQ
jgi:hypothetical protein